ncbi:unnamed protein product [Rhizophagus irregularis]|nr:unnamed protein product [Rhizophagus irregularis]
MCTSILLDDLDSASAPRPESRSLNTSASLRDIHKNMNEFDNLENLSTPLHEVPRSRNSDISTHLREVHTRNTDDLENSLALLHSKSRNSDLSTPLHEASRSRNLDTSTPLHLLTPLREASRSRNLDTSTPLREVHRNTDELDSVSAHSHPVPRDLNTSASLCLINTSASPTLPSCFNDMSQK